ncbi:MAG: HAMP domain-containing sensor histidine kinase [Pseudomonadota bacterium]
MTRRSLRRRIAVAFLGMAVLAGVFGGLLAVLFAYTTEDNIFYRLLTLELSQLEEAIERGDESPRPSLPFATYYRDGELPGFLRVPLEAEPQRREVFGTDGKHYHLRRVEPAGGEPRWIVLQVEDYLVVRPVLTEITAFLGVAILMVILIAGVTGLYLAHRVTGPLRSLAGEVDALEPDDLPREWAARYPPDEVGRLADVLRDAFRRIHRFVDREQRFTQDASHELRTPLAVIESSVTMLGKTTDPAQVDSLVARIRSAAMAMHLSVDALLALAREDDLAHSEERTPVLPIVERTIVNHASLLEGKDIELKVEIEPEWRVAGDAAALQVLIANLLSNAFRYTERGEIRIEQDGGDLLVIDSGAGIDAAIRDDVMKPTVKGEQSPGLGLGLSIVERLCDRYGWRFDLASTAQGTTARLGLGGRSG